MNKQQTKLRTYSLGDLIVTLFEEAQKISLEPPEQRLIVYMAIEHLLTKQTSRNNSIEYNRFMKQKGYFIT